MNKRANVFIFSPLALENGRGGEISSMELASGLQKYYDITLMDTNIIFGKKMLSQSVINKKLKGIRRDKRMRFATFKFFNKIFTFPYPWEILKLYRRVKKHEIIYTSSSTIKFDIILIFLSLIHRKSKFIIGFRKPLHSEKIFSIYNLKYRISILLFSLFQKRFYFHTISEHAKKYLERFYNPKNIFHIIHGVVLKAFIEVTNEKKQFDTLNFIYVGYIDDVHKGVNVLLDGIQKFIDENKNLKVFFEFCGGGPLVPQIIKLQNRYPEHVKYNGYISNDRIHSFYKRNDVFLFTSRREPFGRVIIEALASRLVIICTKTFGSNEILRNKEFAFFLEKLDSDTIKNKIYATYNLWKEKNEKFRELQNEAKNYAIENYSFSRELELFKSLIDWLTKNKN